MTNTRAKFLLRPLAHKLACAIVAGLSSLTISGLAWADVPPNAREELVVSQASGRSETTTSSERSTQTAETVRERYADGQTKIEREVTLDKAGNYVNHGAWRMWDSAGKLIAEGRHDMGQRVGLWKRTHVREESPVLDEFPFNKFSAPFTSQATFVADQLEGDWVINDAKGRQCSRISLVRGKRHGKATLWQPDGQVYREASFQRGVAKGEVLQRDANDQLITVATYVDGHLLVNKVTNFTESEIKESDGSYLSSMGSETSSDDYWELHFAEYATQAEDQRHGAFKQWYANGQLKLEGNFQFDRESGPFVWWHANGQKAVEGEFVDGQQDGQWVWWHANGQKASQGDFHYGTLVGTWRQWDVEGRLAQTQEYQKERIAGRTMKAGALPEEKR